MSHSSVSGRMSDETLPGKEVVAAVTLARQNTKKPCLAEDRARMCRMWTLEKKRFKTSSF